MGMNKRIVAGAGWLLIGAFAGAVHGAPWAKVTTSMGEFTFELNAARAPITVANFERYVREGYYSGTLFHRVVSNFVVQGGGYAATDYQLKPVYDSVVNESGNGLQNKRGTVGLARSGDPHSGNSQFYVNIADNPDLDPVPTRWGYAVFGKVVQGMEVIDRIGVLPTGRVGPFKGEAPLTPVIIERIELLNAPPVDVVPAPSSAPPTPEPAAPSRSESSKPASPDTPPPG
jgi:peptidyl-prolyl cis-trans isomerase A (cyclophilin A)